MNIYVYCSRFKKGILFFGAKMDEYEDEFLLEEDKSLKKALHQSESDESDSEDNVMGFDDEEDEKDSMASDIEGAEENFELPNKKAWGKATRSYYSTDYVDTDYTSVSQKDIADAELEESEAYNLQSLSVKQLDEDDFGLDLIETKLDESNVGHKEHVKVDLSKLSKLQKREMFEKTNPEFLPLLSDLYSNEFHLLIILLIKSKHA